MKTRPARRSCRLAARSAKRGACASISCVMPVSAWISEGSATPGLTSVDHSETTSKRSTSMTPISVTRSLPGRVPVVSRSTIASGACVSSMDGYGIGLTSYATDVDRTFRGGGRRLHPHAMRVRRCDPGAGGGRLPAMPAGGMAGGEHAHHGLQRLQPMDLSRCVRPSLHVPAGRSVLRPLQRPLHGRAAACEFLHARQGLRAHAEE